MNFYVYTCKSCNTTAPSNWHYPERCRFCGSGFLTVRYGDVDVTDLTTEQRKEARKDRDKRD